MSPRSLDLGQTLDDASDLVLHVAAPFAGLLWLATLPLRILQWQLVARLLEMGDKARDYGDYIHAAAWVLVVLFVVSLSGRAVFVKACSLYLRTNAPPGRAAFQIGARSFVAYLYVALLVEAAFFATLALVVLAPLFVLLSGLAAATVPLADEAGLLKPVRLVLRQASEGWHLLGLLAVFAAAVALAALNLYLVFRLGLWLAGGVFGFEASRWEALLDPAHPRFFCQLLGGAALLVEPFWLAAHVIHVRRRAARTSGEDLRLEFERLKKAAA